MKKNVIILILLAVIVFGGILGYQFISKERQKVDKILEVAWNKVPTVREIEVSFWEAANAIFYYTTDPSAVSLKQYQKEVREIDKFMTKYKALIDTEEEKRIAVKLEKLWKDSITEAEGLIKLRQNMIDITKKAWDSVHEADDIIDYKIQPTFIEGIPDLIEKEKFVREIEVSIWEAINATNFYLYSHSDDARREFPLQLEDVNKYWEMYKKLDITATEKPYIKEFEDLWQHSVELMKECNTLADELKEKKLSFWKSVLIVDDVFDFEIQEYMKKRREKKTRL